MTTIEGIGPPGPTAQPRARIHEGNSYSLGSQAIWQNAEDSTATGYRQRPGA